MHKLVLGMQKLLLIKTAAPDLRAVCGRFFVCRLLEHINNVLQHILHNVGGMSGLIFPASAAIVGSALAGDACCGAQSQSETYSLDAVHGCVCHSDYPPCDYRRKGESQDYFSHDLKYRGLSVRIEAWCLIILSDEKHKKYIKRKYATKTC